MSGGRNISTMYIAAAMLLLAGSVAGLYFGFVYIRPGSAPDMSEFFKDSKIAKAGKAASVKLKLGKTDVRQMDGGGSAWRVKAKGIVTDAKTGLSNFKDTTGEIYGEKKQMFTFDAKHAEYDSAGKKLRVAGMFTGRLEPEGHEIRASDLHWEQKSKKVTANNADITMKDAKATGKTMEIDTASRTVSLSGGVRIEIPLNKKKQK